MPFEEKEGDEEKDTIEIIVEKENRTDMIDLILENEELEEDEDVNEDFFIHKKQSLSQ